MSTAINRMQFLRGDYQGDRKPVRPPWSLEETLFVEQCDRCGECATACPEQIIVMGSGGFPQLDFSIAGCEFCGDCVDVCKPGAIVRDERQADGGIPSDWNLKASIKDNCLSLNGVVCRSCGEACDERAIRFQLALGGRAIPHINLETCNGCGWCYGVCPTQSVRISAQSST